MHLLMLTVFYFINSYLSMFYHPVLLILVRKVMGGGGIGGEFSSGRNFFSLSNSLYEFFLGHRTNWRARIFSFNFPLREFFLYFARPTPPPPAPPPISFLMVRP